MGRKKKFWNKDRVEGLKTFFHLNLGTETKKAILVVVFAVLAILILLSIVGVAGRFGIWFESLLLVVFGFVTYLLPLLLVLLLVAVAKAGTEKSAAHGWGKRTGFGLFFILSGFLGIWHLMYLFFTSADPWNFHAGSWGAGVLGSLVASVFLKFFGFIASAVILVGFMAVGIVILTNIAILSIFSRKKEEKPVAETVPVAEKQLKINTPQSADFKEKEVEADEDQGGREEEVETEESTKKDVSVKTGPAPSLIPDAVVIDTKTDWKLPPFDLLEDKKTAVDSGNIEANAAIIQKTLSDFGISVEMGEVNVGPTVTQYTLRPATGVKLAQIAGLKNDLALALAASSIRMELPIPGKPFVGVELPNKASSIVRLREVMQTPDFINHKSPLAFGLGRDVAGSVQVADIAKMPHLLIAGSTGTGKSVALNSLILSLMYRNTPQSLKFILIDPKRVEMTLYNGIPHLITAPITEAPKAVNAMKWAVGEMDRRYKLIAETKRRNIVEYNETAPNKLPYIVVVMDEMADLMAVAQADIEAAVVRLAQMARAVGIHLVLATQSPRVDIITGLIKANISSRMAFKVTSQSESRIILDVSGAEQLLGNGDMLFVSSSDANKPKRVQGSFVSDSEVKKVADFFKAQAGAVIYNDEVVEKPKVGISLPGFSDDSDGDDLLEEAKEEVLRAGKASASFLQRRLKVGYARAARLLDLLEQQGFVGPADGAKPREVYNSSEGNEDSGADFE